MLYGTRKELNKRLKRMFGNEERIALLVWTKQDVMAQVENMTEAEADAVLELIGRAGMSVSVAANRRTVGDSPWMSCSTSISARLILLIFTMIWRTAPRFRQTRP